MSLRQSRCILRMLLLYFGDLGMENALIPVRRPVRRWLLTFRVVESTENSESPTMAKTLRSIRGRQCTDSALIPEASQTALCYVL